MIRSLLALSMVAATLFMGGASQADEVSDFIPGTALRRDFVPLPGEAASMLDAGFILTARQSGVPGSDEALLALRNATCKLLDGGYDPTTIEGFHRRQSALTRRDARAVTLASQEFCPGWGSLSALLVEEQGLSA